jgi:AraC-like DNA-binding protein
LPRTSQPVLHILTQTGFSVGVMRGARSVFASHAHPAYSVVTLLAGSLDLSLPDDRYKLRAGQSALLNVNEVHAAAAREYTICAVRVSNELMDELLSEAGFAVTGASAAFRSTVVRDPVLLNLSGAMVDELAEPRPGQLTMVGSLVRELGVRLLREHLVVKRAPQMELSRAGSVDRRLRLAIELMYENYDRELDLEEIAGAAHLSSFYFQRLFKRLMRVSPHEYLANIRMERARALLLNSTRSINEIARAVGFRSQSHFARVFRDVNGVSPLAFRAGAIAPPEDA